MCGITGFWRAGGVDDPAGVARRMADQLRYRGPDSSGEWGDAAAGLALAHRRLAIIDLSAAGHQPMLSGDERYVLSYNGEIYNHLALRAELESGGAAGRWIGGSDTETLLAAILHWGVEGALRRLNGMFAFALWDRRERELYLARDRLGEKPLYYGWQGGTLLFGSELKAFRAHPDWQGEVDRDALTLFFRYGYIPAPHSIYRGIRKLPPAHYLKISAASPRDAEPVCYWSLQSVADEGRASRVTDPDAAVDELAELLRDSVALRMTSDVPLGAFLSGGVDSSTVVALMQAQSAGRVRTFSIGFDEEAYDEAKAAKQVAQLLGTDHTELYVRPDEAMAVIPQLPSMWDEPFADVSQIPTYLVSKLARSQVTVSLSGDGGDELFYGYTRYELARRMWNAARIVPAPLRGAVGKMAETAGGTATLLRNAPRMALAVDRLSKAGSMLAADDRAQFYRNLLSHAQQPDRMVLNGREPELELNPAETGAELFAEHMMLADTKFYLPDDILTKVDRASMAVSLEARVPLLDHRIVEYSWRLPVELKRRGGVAKWPLKQVLSRHLPPEVWDRPKKGFSVPIAQWLRGPLRGWAEDLLDERRLEEDGFLDARRIRQMWAEELSGARRWHYCLWDVLMFQAWRATEAPL